MFSDFYKGLKWYNYIFSKVSIYCAYILHNINGSSCFKIMYYYLLLFIYINVNLKIVSRFYHPFYAIMYEVINNELYINLVNRYFNCAFYGSMKSSIINYTLI